MARLDDFALGGAGLLLIGFSPNRGLAEVYLDLCVHYRIVICPYKH